jgi:hypothetical protein
LEFNAVVCWTGPKSEGTRTKDGTCASSFPLKVRRVSEISPLKNKRKIQKTRKKKKKVNFVILMKYFAIFRK